MRQLAYLLPVFGLLFSCANPAESQAESSNTGSLATKAKCETTNAALESMPLIDVTLTRQDGSQHKLEARHANNNATRAAGFQRVCESTIASTPILFTFPRPTVPSFHMNNVVAAIDIAFIAQGGRIDTVYTMQPYSLVSLKKPLYSPNKPVLAALEAHENFYLEQNIDASAKITWRKRVQEDSVSDTP